MLEVAIVWSDPDLREIVVSASSEYFAGAVSLYAGPTELTQLADRLHAFPTDTTDRRQILLGQDNLSGYGTARITLYCKDATGHVVLEIALRSNPVDLRTEPESCVVQVPAVPADIDRFEAELRSLDNHVGGRAILRSAA